MGENIGHGYNGQKATTKNTSSRNIQKNYKLVRKIKTTQSKNKAGLNSTSFFHQTYMYIYSNIFIIHKNQ